MKKETYDDDGKEIKPDVLPKPEPKPDLGPDTPVTKETWKEVRLKALKKCQSNKIDTGWVHGSEKEVLEKFLATGEIPEGAIPDTPQPKRKRKTVSETGELSKKDIEARISGIITEVVKKVSKEAKDNIKKAVADEFNKKKYITSQTFKVKRASKSKVEDIGLQHFKFPLLMKLVECRQNIFLAGIPGAGKTHIAKSVADVLGLKFYSQSVCPLTSEAHIKGYMSATGKYVSTAFREAYEFGGVYLMDEIDAGSPAVLLVMNSALANEFCPFPDKMVKRHKDFVFIAGANTIGLGATSQFVGRNTLDAATLDRFVFMTLDIDLGLEAQLSGVKEKQEVFNVSEGGTLDSRKWLERVRRIRLAVEDLNERIIVSPRASISGNILLQNGVGLKHVEDLIFWDKMDQIIRRKVKDHAEN